MGLGGVVPLVLQCRLDGRIRYKTVSGHLPADLPWVVATVLHTEKLK